jgi:dTDP-4-dehydrorhamnose reductase
MLSRILIIGAGGLIGSALTRYLGARRTIPLARNNTDIDAQHFDALQHDPRTLELNTEAISHGVILAAETSIEKCVRERGGARALNVEATCRIIDWMLDEGITPVFASSDMVFDGKAGGYIETDRANPMLTYGRLKQEVEDYLIHRTDNYLVVRYSKVMSSDPLDATEFTYWRNAIENGALIRCADDQSFSAIDLQDAVEGLAALIEMDAHGIMHLGGPFAWSRAELFECLFAELKCHRPTLSANMEVCSIHDFTEFAEPRPLDISMNSSKFTEMVKLLPRDLRETCRIFAENAYLK